MIRKQVKSITDYGFDPAGDRDCTKALRAAAFDLTGRQDVKLVFPKGIYTVADPRAISEMSDLMDGFLHPDTKWGRTDQPYNSAFALENAERFELDGQGSVFVYRGLVQPFEFTNCRNVIIRNLSMDWDRPLFSNGTLLSVDNDMVFVDIDIRKYPLQGGEPVWSVMSYDVHTQRYGRASGNPGGALLVHVKDHVFRFTARGFKEFLPGSGMNLRHLHNYRPGFYFSRCRDTVMEDITIHAVGGMGVIGFQSENFAFERFGVRPGHDRIMSSNTDATHFISCTGDIRFDDCYFEGMGDDAVNVHGFYLSVVESMDPRTLLVTIDTRDITQNREFDPPSPGDLLEFVSGIDLSVYARNQVKSIVLDESGWCAKLELAKPVPAEFRAEDLIANASRTARLTFANSTVANNRARGLLIQSRGALIENCLFDSCTGTGIHVNTAANWKESIGTTDIIIRNNTFRKCGFGDGEINGASAIAVTTESQESRAGVHRRIRIENNRIQGRGGLGIYVGALSDGTLEGNSFDQCAPAVHVEFSSGVRLLGNRSAGQDRKPVAVTTGEGCASIEIL